MSTLCILLIKKRKSIYIFLLEKKPGLVIAHTCTSGWVYNRPDCLTETQLVRSSESLLLVENASLLAS
jgi:hypothetical protein